MGIEPTGDGMRPPIGFEDRERHQATNYSQCLCGANVCAGLYTSYILLHQGVCPAVPSGPDDFIRLSH